MSRPVLIIHGPNLNLLGKREPEIYGRETLADIDKRCVEHGQTIGLAVTCFQSNAEGEIVDAIQQAAGKQDAIVINAGALTHTSIAIRDALAAVSLPVYEVHLSNVHAREEFRHRSYISGIARAVICGLGARGYLAALDAIADE